MATRKRAVMATPGTPAATAVPPLALPAELTIYTVGELHPRWRDWLLAVAADDSAAVQADAVDQVDGAGLQLLLSLAHGFEGRNRRLQLHAPSNALREGCAALGLADWLQGHTAPGVPA